MANQSLRFSSIDLKWSTPRYVYAALDHEFRFNLTPCRADDGSGLSRCDGLAMSWRGKRVFANPPFGLDIPRWLAKAKETELAVFLLPARTDVAWYHDHCLAKATEIRFLRGRLRLNGAKSGAPFPSMIVIYRGTHG